MNIGEISDIMLKVMAERDAKSAFLKSDEDGRLVAPVAETMRVTVGNKQVL